MLDFATARRMMVDGQVRTADVTDPRLLGAMLELPRERFMPGDKAQMAYLDIDLPVGEFGARSPRRMLKPMVLAKLLQAAEIGETDRVLDIGSGAGLPGLILSILNTPATIHLIESDQRKAAFLREVHDGACEVVIHHAGHGDEELVGQVDGMGGAFRHAMNLGQPLPAGTRHAPRCALRMTLLPDNPMNDVHTSALVWLRRDLRCHDHAALFHALKNARKVWCAFVFDTAILAGLPRADRRVGPDDRVAGVAGRSRQVDDDQIGRPARGDPARHPFEAQRPGGVAGHHGERFLGRRKTGEFLHVRAGDEARLRRADHEAPGLRRGDLVESGSGDRLGNDDARHGPGRLGAEETGQRRDDPDPSEERKQCAIRHENAP